MQVPTPVLKAVSVPSLVLSTNPKAITTAAAWDMGPTGHRSPRGQSLQSLNRW